MGKTGLEVWQASALAGTKFAWEWAQFSESRFPSTQDGKIDVFVVQLFWEEFCILCMESLALSVWEVTFFSDISGNF